MLIYVQRSCNEAITSIHMPAYFLEFLRQSIEDSSHAVRIYMATNLRNVLSQIIIDPQQHYRYHFRLVQ